MSEFHTRSEIASNAEFIAYLEQLLSGSLSSGTGINRALERLAENQNALLDAVQTAKIATMSGGGIIAYAPPNLTFSSNFVIQMVNELGGARTNIILSASESPIVLNANGELAYVVLDRVTEGAALTVSVAADLAAFLATIAGDTERLDYLILCYRTANGVIFFDGQRVKNGQSLTYQGFTDNQYGQQTELTLVHENQKENFKLFLTRGGTLTWDQGTATLTWSDDLTLEFPQVAGDNTVAAGSAVIPVGSAAYFSMTRTPGASIPKAFSVVALGNAALSGDNVFVGAVHAADGRLYLWDGTALSDGDSVRLGGMQSGVQFFYYNPGTATQVTDITEAGAYPNRSYDRGSGALMVYRNGVKAKGSYTAYWNGLYPAGALVGAKNIDDEYLEEDDGSGNNTGNRIIWLRDDVGGGEPQKHPTGSHDPPFTWPQTDDHLEIFVGLVGEGPSPVESIQAFDSGGVPIAGDPIDGAVGLQGSANITLTYLGNRIVVSSSIAAGVSGWELDGGTFPNQTGLFTLVQGTKMLLDDTTPTELVINCSVEDLEDLDDVSPDLADSVKGVTDPSASNVMLTHLDSTSVVGFDAVWAADPDTIKTVGGVLRVGDAVYRSSTALLECTTSDLYGAETLLNSRWYALYAGPGVSSGDPPVLKISRYFPTLASGVGVHPSNPNYAYLAPVFVDSGGNFTSFSKINGFVCLGEGYDVDSVFGSVVGASYASVNVTGDLGLSDKSWPVVVRVRLELQGDGGGRGEMRRIYVRTQGFTGARQVWSVMSEDDEWSAEFDMPVGPNGGFEAMAQNSDNFDSVLRARVTGFWEGRQTVAEEMGA